MCFWHFSSGVHPVFATLFEFTGKSVTRNSWLHPWEMQEPSLLWRGSKHRKRYWQGRVTLLVSQGCRNKLPQTGGFREQKAVCFQFWRPEVWNQGVGSVDSLWRLWGTVRSRLWACFWRGQKSSMGLVLWLRGCLLPPTSYDLPPGLVSFPASARANRSSPYSQEDTGLWI